MSHKVPYLDPQQLIEVFRYTKTATAIHVGEDAVVQMANDAMLHIWGKDSSVIGKSLEDALPELKGQPFGQMFKKVWTQGITLSGVDTPADLEVEGVVSTYYFDFEYRAVKDANDKVICVLHSATDVTARVLNKEIQEYAARIQDSLTREQSLNEELAAANEELNAINEELSANQEQLHALNQQLEKKVEERVNSVKVELEKEGQRKNDFIAMVSHELKTPLTSLNAHIQLLQRKYKGNGDSFTESSLQMAEKQVKKMTAMINGFLDVSRLESANIYLKKTDFLLNDLIESAVEEAVMMHSSHTISYVNEHQLLVQADFEKIGNVISNLLSNAIKYAPMNPDIMVKCELVEGMVRVSVKDQGIGIAAKDIGHLFERFYRVDTGSHISGFGIGLYLSAEIIEKHNGRIWAESEHGHGTTFFFELPLHATI